VPDVTDSPKLGTKFQEALQLAQQLHRHHLRNSTDVPYVSHLLSVAALVLEDGGDEDEAIAALLHDALEDCSDQVSAEDLEHQFGSTVCGLVKGCTDTPPNFSGDQKPPWKRRKEKYIQHVREGGASRVSLADKVHNARSILRDHRLIGDEVFSRFSAAKADTLWYYQELALAYRSAGHAGFLMDELERVVAELMRRTAPAQVQNSA
jgi:(p)ppGpp synthase/HD superfamily hydrolase